MGQLVQVIPETDYSFDGRINAIQEVGIGAAYIDSVDWATGVLAVRLHTKPAWTGTGQVKVLVRNAMYAPEEPHTLFVVTTAIATVTILNGDAAPQLYVQALSTPIAPMVKVILRWEQGATAPSSPCAFSIGVDLVGRM